MSSLTQRAESEVGGSWVSQYREVSVMARNTLRRLFSGIVSSTGSILPKK
jgi:hypothetical protein